MTIVRRGVLLTVGSSPELVRNLWSRIAQGQEWTFVHLAHPRYTSGSWSDASTGDDVRFFFESDDPQFPTANPRLLADLESPGIPTLHNMILGDPVLSELPYEDVLEYATAIAQRLRDLIASCAPLSVIGSFDGLHGSMSCAVAKRLGVPWFALHFSSIPDGMACFCDRLTPAARVTLPDNSMEGVEDLAAKTINEFLSRRIVAPAFRPQRPRAIGDRLTRLAHQTRKAFALTLRHRVPKIRRYTDSQGSLSVTAAVSGSLHAVGARRAARRLATILRPPSRPFVFFGLHMQPESSIDVWAPFYSDQNWVVELLSRTIPPTHKLLVKLHKSDFSRFGRKALHKMASLPGVVLVSPFANAIEFIERADLIFAIQGTIGLEAALSGRPVIMLGESPYVSLPSVCQVGQISELPQLVRAKLASSKPGDAEIRAGFSEYLRPFAPASANDWSKNLSEPEIASYQLLFARLLKRLTKA